VLRVERTIVELVGEPDIRPAPRALDKDFLKIVLDLRSKGMLGAPGH